MKTERILGNNIYVMLKNSGVDVATAANDLGYDKEDLTKICEGRKYLSFDEIKDFAAYFKITSEELLCPKSDEEYENAGCIHYNHHFKDQSNLEKIMDIFDWICDVEEAL